MQAPNRIAVIGHRGWASSAIVIALSVSTVPIKVLYHAASDISDLPPSVEPVLVDFEDESTLVSAFQDVDIVISLVGHNGVPRQHILIRAIQKTKVQLFSPSDLAARYDEEGLQVPVNRAKDEVEKAARDAGIPVVVILPGNFAEFALNTLAMGVDVQGNKIVYTDNSERELLNVCTRSYVAEAYASIFIQTPVAQLKNRTIGLSEIQLNGKQLAGALEMKHRRPPTIYHHRKEKVDTEIRKGLSSGSPFTLAWYCRKIWGSGQQARMIGTDIWDLPGYPKATLQQLIVDGQLGSYREMPPEVVDFFIPTFATA